MSARCAVDWCACLPVKGSDVCAAHKIDPKLKPVELTEEQKGLADGTADECKECDGSGECQCCNGTGHQFHSCKKCYDDHQIDCHSCWATGECEMCNGTGAIKKKVAA